MALPLLPLPMLCRAALAQALEAKRRAEEAQADAAAALRTAERKAEQAKQDNSSMLNEYDSYLHNLLSKKASSSAGNGSSGAPEATAGVASTAGDRHSLLSHAITAKGADDGLWQAEVDKYDRIAALLSGRQSGVTLTGEDRAGHARAHGRLSMVATGRPGAL